MRNKIFIFVIVIIAAAVMIFSPAYKMLYKLGLVHWEDTGNYIDREITHEGALGSLLNGIEDAKADINDIYINYIPFYDAIVITMQGAIDTANMPMTTALTRVSAYLRESLKAKNEGEKEAETDTDTGEPVPTDTGSEVISTTPDPDSTDYITEDSGVVTTEPPAPPVELGAKVILMKPSNHHRFYLLEAEVEPGVWVRFHDKVVEYNELEATKRMSAHLAQVNRLARANTDVNFFVYVCARLQESPMAEKFFPDEICTGELLNKFLAGLDKRIHYDVFELETIEERLEKVYLTDHHWTPEGAYEGYTEIINMIRGVVPVISEPRTPIKYSIEGLQYYGANARTFNNFSCFDPFYFYDYSLPYHTQTGGNSFSKMKGIYLRGEYNTAQKADHYTIFFKPLSGNSKMTKFVYPGNKTGRNLLLIGDSFAFGLSEIIASHFDTTIHREIRNSNPIDYNEFIRENNITDVLILQIASRLLFDVVNDSRYNMIITK